MLVVGGAGVLGVLGLVASLVAALTGAGRPKTLDRELVSPGPALRALARHLGGTIEGQADAHRPGLTTVTGTAGGRAARVELEVRRDTDATPSRWLRVAVATPLAGAWTVHAPSRFGDAVGAVAGVLLGVEAGPTITVEAHGLRLVAPRIPGTAPADPRAATVEERLRGVLEDEVARAAILALVERGSLRLDAGWLVASRPWSPEETEPAALRRALELLPALAERLEGEHAPAPGAIDSLRDPGDRRPGREL
jgi:hypothetical protein